MQELLQTLLEARRQKKEFVDAVGPIAERARSPIRQAVVQTRRRGPWIAAGVIGMLAVLWFAAMRPFYDSAARTLGVELVPMPVESVAEIERSIAYHAAQPNAGLIVMPDGFLIVNSTLIIRLAPILANGAIRVSAANVCFWHKADIRRPPTNVRFRG